MSARKQFQSTLKMTADFERLLKEAQDKGVTDEELKEQRVSFAFGNAPQDSKLITKESVRVTSKSIRLKA